MLEQHLEKISNNISLINCVAIQAKDIIEYVLSAMQQRCTQLNGDINLTEQYYFYDLKPPDEFTYVIKLEHTTKITPIRVMETPGCIRLKTAVRNNVHAGESTFIVGNYIDHQLVQFWVDNILKSLYRQSVDFVSRRKDKYSIQFNTDRLVVEQRDYPGRRIFINVMPCFEFNANQWCFPKELCTSFDRCWLAVPPKGISSLWENSKNLFTICTPNWEREILINRIVLNKSLRMMIILRDVHKMNELSNYMLKTLYFVEDERQNDVFWKKSLTEILFYMLRKLLWYLKQNHLPYNWDKNQSLLKEMSPCNRLKYIQILKYILIMLESFKQDEHVCLANVERLF